MEVRRRCTFRLSEVARMVGVLERLLLLLNRSLCWLCRVDVGWETMLRVRMMRAVILLQLLGKMLDVLRLMLRLLMKIWGLLMLLGLGLMSIVGNVVIN